MLQLIFRSLVAHLKTQIEYRFAFALEMFTNSFMYALSYLGIWILLDRFQVIEGWTFWEVMLLFNLNLLAFGLSSLIFRAPMEEVERLIQYGTFDSVLVRPLNPLLYILSRGFHHVYIPHVVLSVPVLVITFTNLNIHWTGAKAVFLALDLAGAVLIISAVYVASSALCFWVIRAGAVKNTVIYSIREAVNYPITIYGKGISAVLTFGIPYAFISFLPAQYLLDGKGETLFHPALQYGTPVVGIVMFFFAYRFWKRGVDRYESTGS